MANQKVTYKDILSHALPNAGLPPSKIQLDLKVRALRQAKNWTLNDLADATGLAVSTLSKIENDRMSPTFDVVQKLATGFSIDIASLFSSAQNPLPQTRRSVIRKGEGRPYETSVYNHLMLASDLSAKRILPFVTVIKARSIDEFEDLNAHDGEEFVYVLEGSVRFYTDFYEPADLNEGDGLYIDSSMRHACITTSQEDAKVLWINSG
ncbi:helix-turn-helix domain-containing protein [uncultured Paraglaciecola sp.]|uniref:helix-turn-helix domain-containing protein n=1 Tax=uncultured Paraglaciecola sp. TaxID=1765024 RepID=UPI00260643E0|nr:XRE family transcriptional regulator [uncultured Paraglaciecola sp.]